MRSSRLAEAYDRDAPGLAGTYTVLIVDDEPAVRRAIAALLNEVGYRIFEAAHGGEALQVLTRHPGQIDLVLADVRMPGTDGVQLGRIMRERHPRQRIMYMSGEPLDVVEQYDLLRSAVPLLEKPFSREMLLSRISEAMAAPAPDGDDRSARTA